MKQSIAVTETQSQILSQSQVQFLHMLSMNNQDLEQWMDLQFAENPLLEKDPVSKDPLPLEYYIPSRERDSGQNRASFHEPFFLEGKELYHFLTEQLTYADYDSHDWEMITFLIYNLDERGFFPLDLSKEAKKHGYSLARLEFLLEIMQNLEPYGIFSPNMATCYLKQLSRKNINDPLLTQVIRQDLDDLLHRRLSRLHKKYGMTSQILHEYLEILADLSPYPLFCFQNGSTCSLIPDVICHWDNGLLVPVLHDSVLSDYNISDRYYGMLQKTEDPTLKRYLSQKLTAANQILKNADSRRRTLLAITTAILEKQSLFFYQGRELIPMSMAQIGEICCVSTSTVSRAIHDKYLQYPGGMIKMKHLFVSSSDAGSRKEWDASPDTVKEILSQIIATENPKQPYGDDAIANILKMEGITISRRTVAKYRNQLFIPTSRERKER